MGADMLLTSLPAPRITPERLARLHETIDRLTDAELRDGLGHLDEGPKGVREELHTHVGLLEGVHRRRDVTVLHLDRMPYPLAFTGGMSWGDDPTEMFDTFAVLDSLEAVFDQMEQWAQEDAAAEHAASGES